MLQKQKSRREFHGGFFFVWYLILLDHDNLGAAAGTDAAVKVDDVLVDHADAAGRGGGADRRPFRRTVDTEQRVLSLFVEEIHGARAERVEMFEVIGRQRLVAGGERGAVLIAELLGVEADREAVGAGGARARA